MRVFGTVNLLTAAAVGLLIQHVHSNPFNHKKSQHPSAREWALHRRDVSVDCKLSVATDMWTTCQSLLDHYNMPLPDFVQMNPSVDSDCYNFQPGEHYCIRMLTSFPKSTDGSCGAQAANNVTCIGSGFGDCCGKSGKCGSADEYCAIGYCQAGICPGLGYSTDGNCGTDYKNLMCGGPFGNCCSNDGKCGSTSSECGQGNCQSGECEGTSTTPVMDPPSTLTGVPLPSPFKPSPDGSCGYLNKFTCSGTEFHYGKCCSAAGYCGVDRYHCSDLLGCQPEFGLCDMTVKVTMTGNNVTAPTPSS